MRNENSGASDAVTAMLRAGRAIAGRGGAYGHATYELFDAAGELIQAGRLVRPDGTDGNLITDNGDEYNARQHAGEAPQVLTGMRLGTGGATAPAKNGAGAAIVTYTTGSSKVFDGAATVSDLGAGLGWRAQWVTTWNPGEATASGMDEAVLTDENPVTDVAGVAADTFARGLLSPAVNKGAGDTLVVTWNVDFNGA